MSTRDQYVRNLQAKLDTWNADIDTLSAKADKVTADLKTEYGEQIEALKAKQAVAKQKLGELQLSGDCAWEDLKSGIDLALTAMGKAIETARSRFS